MEEIKKLLEDCECTGYRCPHEISGKHYVMISEDVDDLIDLAVSKERERIVELIKSTERMVAVTDNDGHRYQIPESKQKEWDTYCEIPSDDERSWDTPDFAERIDGMPVTSFKETILSLINTK